VKKNVSSQVVGAQMVSASDGSAFTGAVTCYVTGNGGTQAVGSVGSGACTHEGNGFHTYTPAQAETNYDHVAFTFIGTGAVPVTVQIYTTFPQTGDNYTRLGAPVGASLSADIAAVQADTDNLQTRIPAALVGGRMDASVGAIATGAVDADAIAADAVAEIQSGLATASAITALDNKLGSPSNLGSGANLAANLVDIESQTDDIGSAGAGLTAIPWNAAWDAEVQSEVEDGLVAHRLDELLNADSDIDGLTPPTVGSVFHEVLSKTAGSFTYDQTTDSLEAIRDKAADIETDTAEIGVAGAGLTNITLPDQTMNITGNITGNLSGSVGSVTGAVGSVTGNVGGNVVGSIGSLAAQAKADVNAEVLDVLNVDTFAEPGQEAPAATNTLVKKIGYLFKFLRNKVTQDATTLRVYADDAVTVDHKATVSDDGTTYTRGEIGTGP